MRQVRIADGCCARNADRSARLFRTAIVFAGLLCVLSTVPATGVEPPEKSARARIQQLITKLGSSRRQERVAAEKSLQELGPDILDLLPSPDLIRNVSARQAVRRIRIRLEHEAARRSIEPSTITLNRSGTLHEVVQAIEDQTGNQLSMERIGKTQRLRNLSVNWRKAFFWTAVGDLQKHGFISEFNPETGVLELHAKERSTDDEPFVTKVSGPFRIRCLPVVSRPVPGSETHLLSASVILDCEPRLRPLFLRYRSNDLSLSAEETKLPAFDSEGTVEIPLGVSGRRSTFAVRHTSKSVPDRIRLSGTVHMLTAAAERPIVFSQLGKSNGVTRRRGGVSVTVLRHRIRPAEANSGKRFDADVRVRVNYDVGANAFESHQTWVFHNRVFLSDESGAVTLPTSFETLFQADGSVGVEYHFENLSRDPGRHAFTYVAPTLLINVPVRLDVDRIPVTVSAGE